MEDKVQAIRDFPLPLTQRKLREFLGLVNFYHRFVPSCAQTLQPLHDLLKTAPKGTAPLTWTEAATAAFQSIKDALANATLLVHPQPEAPTSILTDASSSAVGAVLQQRIDDMWCPLVYLSRKLTPAQQKYNTFDRELLAIYLALKRFHYFVEGRDFYIITDTSPSRMPSTHGPTPTHPVNWTISPSSLPTSVIFPAVSKTPFPAWMWLLWHVPLASPLKTWPLLNKRRTLPMSQGRHLWTYSAFPYQPLMLPSSAMFQLGHCDPTCPRSSADR